ncbi:MAG: hypothetical protein R3E85_07575 [Planctomycetota bacterium]
MLTLAALSTPLVVVAWIALVAAVVFSLCTRSAVPALANACGPRAAPRSS